MLAIILFGTTIAISNIAHIKDSPVYYPDAKRSKKIKRWLGLASYSVGKGLIQGLAWPIMLPVKVLCVLTALLTGDDVGKYFTPGRLLEPPALHYGCC